MVASNTAVGVVGGGVAGIACASRLARSGVPVTLYEAAPRIGGRLRATTYVKAKDPRFQAQLDTWRRLECLAEWDATPHSITSPGSGSKAAPESKDTAWYIGTPHMSAPLEFEAKGLANVRRNTAVSRAEQRPSGWSLIGEGGTPLGEHGELVVALPVARAAELLPFGKLRQALPMDVLGRDFEKARYVSTLRFEAPLRLPYDFAFAAFKGAAVTVLIDEASRRATVAGRRGNGGAPGTCWIAQTDTKWAARQLEAGTPASDVGRMIVEEVAKMVGPLPPLAGCETGCWKYGDADYALNLGFRRLPTDHLTLAGDWAYNGRVEGAWLSGWDAAGALLAGGRNDPSDCW